MSFHHEQVSFLFAIRFYHQNPIPEIFHILKCQMTF
ncbi:hypothetical protein FHR87_002030 [Azomonas macrocytogenes]|uniref:Uncharacterized protein n=1 Tax=Azomonas macrocytogenes TaxID=69962 RepID=A0A839T5Q6_AZOMA|nr:hypothetical protein [Azomonas macrocytogenes]